MIIVMKHNTSKSNGNLGQGIKKDDTVYILEVYDERKTYTIKILIL
jgi:hypothetical protein